MAEDHKDNDVTWLTLEDGTNIGITTEDVLAQIARIDSSLVSEYVKITPIARDLARFDFDVSALQDGAALAFDNNTGIPVAVELDETDYLRTDIPYFAMIENERGLTSNERLWSCDPSAIAQQVDGTWTAKAVKLVFKDGGGTVKADSVAQSERAEDGTIKEITLGDFGLDPESLYSFRNEKTGDYLTFSAVYAGIVTLCVTARIAERVREQRGKGPMVLRAGREMTAAMEATTKRSEIYENSDGGDFVMANEIMISAAKAGGLTVSTGAKKTLAFLNHKATMSGYGYEPNRNCVVSTSVAEIMEARGLADTDKNRRRVRADVKALARWSFELEDKKTQKWVRIPLAGGAVQIKRGGDIAFSISADFMRAALNSRAGLLPMDPALMRTDDKLNPLAWAIGYKLACHTYMNKGAKNESTLSVRKLLEHLADVPKPEAVRGKNYTQKIIAPVERDLSALVELGVLEWWDYCRAKGEPLTDDEQAARLDKDGNDAPLPYKYAIRANIQWQLSNSYEEHMAQVLAAREKRKAEAEAARERAKRRKGRMEHRTERRVADLMAQKEVDKRTREGGENVPSK